MVASGSRCSVVGRPSAWLTSCSSIRALAVSRIDAERSRSRSRYTSMGGFWSDWMKLLGATRSSAIGPR
ncbi:MAG: hypothetical protein IPF99_21905 [Deltaproteobacteria bacterium]|nr:hypothetical protein [Deltaproteobacteria bacterium]